MQDPANRREQARVTVARTHVAELAVALGAFKLDLGRYPTTAEGLRALVEAPSPNAKGWQGPYVLEMRRDPWGNDYLYQCPGRRNPDGYDLGSAGPDGQAGTPDDLTNPTLGRAP
jgi:general secretion pathway protein G